MGSGSSPRDYFKFYRILLTTLGLWSGSDPRTSSTLYRIFGGAMAFFFGVLFITSEFLSLFHISDRMGPFASNLCYFLGHTFSTIKATLFLIKRKQIQRICVTFDDSIFALNAGRDESEMKIVDHVVRVVNVYLFIYNVMGVVCEISGCMAPFFREPLDNNTLTLPYYAYLPYEIRSSFVYQLTYVYQTLASSYCTLVIIHCDMFFFALASHCSCQFKFLQRSLESLNERGINNVAMRLGYGDAKTSRTDATFRRELALETHHLVQQCVKHHHVVIALAEQLESLYNLNILVQFTVDLILICFQLVLLTKVPPGSFEGIGMIGFLIGMTLGIFIFCKCGHDIETESWKMSRAAYLSDWTSFPEPVKRMLLCITIRSQRPVRFTLGKFTVLSLGTFVSVMRGSTSYFMVLRRMQ